MHGKTMFTTLLLGISCLFIKTIYNFKNLTYKLDCVKKTTLFLHIHSSAKHPLFWRLKGWFKNIGWNSNPSEPYPYGIGVILIQWHLFYVKRKCRFGPIVDKYLYNFLKNMPRKFIITPSFLYVVNTRIFSRKLQILNIFWRNICHS